MSTEPETPQKATLFDWIRYIAIAVLAVVIIWWALKPPVLTPSIIDDDPDSQTTTETASSLVQCHGLTMGEIGYCVKVSGWPVNGKTAADQEKELSKTVQSVLDLIDSTMSTYRTDSEVSRFNGSNSTDWFPVSPETAKVVQAALDVSELTQGTFDITVGPLVNRWGFGPEEYDNFPSQDEIDELLLSVGPQHLAVQLAPPAIMKDAPHLKIDLSGIAKGFAVDQVAAELGKMGIKNYMIEVGGETRTAGEKSPGKPWTIGIELPTPQWLDEPKIHCMIRLGSQSMATSGDYNNFADYQGVRFSHIIDPRTGWPAEKNRTELPESQMRLFSVSVVDPNCMKADALTKGFYVLGVEDGLKLANDNGIAVLFLLREQTPAKRGPGPKFTVREIMSDAFKKIQRVE